MGAQTNAFLSKPLSAAATKNAVPGRKDEIFTPSRLQSSSKPSNAFAKDHTKKRERSQSDNSSTLQIFFKPSYAREKSSLRQIEKRRFRLDEHIAL